MYKKIILKDFDELLERPVKPFGNSAYVAIPKQHIGKLAYVAIGTNKTQPVFDRSTGNINEVLKCKKQ